MISRDVRVASLLFSLTVTLLHMLNNGYYLTSNDKALISREGKCVGTCQRIGIQEYTMDKYNIQKNDAIIIEKNIICGL